tara:strand:- start:536 stop:940 length:405 start_codon:yes stop_codon:yes gene_type:complete
MKKPIKNKNTNHQQNKRNRILYKIRKICKSNPKIKSKIKKIKDINKRLYYAQVWEVTENQPLFLLENSKQRGWKNYHLDHIFPIAIAYSQEMSPKKVGNIKNLRFIPYQENLNKGATLTTESKNALQRIKRLRK